MITTDLSILSGRRIVRPEPIYVPTVAPARVPAPPALPQDGDPEQEAPRLARQFGLGILAELGRLTTVGTLKSAPRRWSRWGQVSAAIEDLRARGCPPAAYIRYALRMWRDYMRRREPPPLSWAFSGLTDKHADKAAGEAAGMGGAVVITPAYAALSRLRTAIARGEPASPAEVRRLVATATWEAERERDRLARDVLEGWPW